MSDTPESQQMLPYCARSEEGMVGCICQNAALLDEMALTADHFLTFECRQVFEAAKELHGQGKGVDVFSVQSQLGPEIVAKIQHHRMSQITFYPSPQMAGTFYAILSEKLTLRRAYLMGDWLKRSSLESKDVNALCEDASKRAADLSADAIGDNILEDAVKQAYERLNRMDRGEKPKLVMTPITAWNKLFGGIGDGRFYALASRPGLGKTAMMEQMITQYLALDWPVIVFEKDMSPQMLVERIACREAGAPYWKYDREVLSDVERRNVRRMLSALDPGKLLLFNPNGLTAEKMCAIARREIRAKKAKAVFLDHIQVLRFPGKDLREGLTQSSLTIRQNVTETGVPHIVLAHINREGAEGRPKPENIKEFDQLFGDVDALALLWSEVEAAENTGEHRAMKLYAAKNRGGAVMEEDLTFNGPLLKFV
jgi:replicative DNA helicase